MNAVRTLKFRIKCIFSLFLFPFYRLSKNYPLMLVELRRWEEVLNTVHYKSNFLCFVRMCAGFPEYRSLLLHRLGKTGQIISILIPHQQSTYFITDSDKIGVGLVLQHGFSSILFPESMGKNCQVWHNVTIGRSHDKGPRPRIGNNVKISAGAIVLGDITIGDNTVIGAGSVVVKNIPNNCVVCGNPARIIKKNGIKVDIAL